MKIQYLYRVFSILLHWVRQLFLGTMPFISDPGKLVGHVTGNFISDPGKLVGHVTGNFISDPGKLVGHVTGSLSVTLGNLWVM